MAADCSDPQQSIGTTGTTGTVGIYRQFVAVGIIETGIDVRCAAFDLGARIGKMSGLANEQAAGFGRRSSWSRTIGSAFEGSRKSAGCGVNCKFWGLRPFRPKNAHPNSDD
jgi:hypothetical protein